jgi:hypothetical protein
MEPRSGTPIRHRQEARNLAILYVVQCVPAVLGLLLLLFLGRFTPVALLVAASLNLMIPVVWGFATLDTCRHHHPRIRVAVWLWHGGLSAALCWWLAGGPLAVATDIGHSLLGALMLCVGVALLAAVVALPVLAVVLAWQCARAQTLCDSLRRKGYDWVDWRHAFVIHHMASWRAFLLPPRDEAAAIPYHDPASPRGLAALALLICPERKMLKPRRPIPAPTQSARDRSANAAR